MAAPTTGSLVRLMARLFAGEAPVIMATESRSAASNAKAKRELGWTLRYPSWRQGFHGRGRVARRRQQRHFCQVRRDRHSPSARR